MPQFVHWFDGQQCTLSIPRWPSGWDLDTKVERCKRRQIVSGKCWNEKVVNLLHTSILEVEFWSSVMSHMQIGIYLMHMILLICTCSVLVLNEIRCFILFYPLKIEQSCASQMTQILTWLLAMTFSGVQEPPKEDINEAKESSCPISLPKWHS